MRYLFGMDREVVEHLKDAWDYLDSEFGLDQWPTVRPTVELCLHTTVHELISLHYILDYDLEEYLHHCNWHHIDDYISAIFDSDRYGEIFDDIVDMLESSVYEGNKLAISISRKSLNMRNATVLDEPVIYDSDDIQRSLANAVTEAIIDTLRTVEILDYLPDVKNDLAPRYRMPIEDVDINFSKLRLTILH